jgi:hypothetical protein
MSKGYILNLFISVKAEKGGNSKWSFKRAGWCREIKIIQKIR